MSGNGENETSKIAITRRQEWPFINKLQCLGTSSFLTNNLLNTYFNFLQ